MWEVLWENPDHLSEGMAPSLCNVKYLNAKSIFLRRDCFIICQSLNGYGTRDLFLPILAPSSGLVIPREWFEVCWHLIKDSWRGLCGTDINMTL